MKHIGINLTETLQDRNGENDKTIVKEMKGYLNGEIYKKDSVKCECQFFKILDYS